VTFIGTPDETSPVDLTEQHIAAVARFVKQDGSVAGTGWLVDAQHVITCAHVVTDALGLPEETGQRPTAELKLDLPQARLFEVPASVVAWHPVLSGAAREQALHGRSDIAVLRLTSAVSADIPPLVLEERPIRREQMVHSYGFRQRQGVHADGRVLGPVASGWLEVDGIATSGFFIEPGFSGAPVWIRNDENSPPTVIGMAVADCGDPARKVGFVLPQRTLAVAWPPLARPYRGLSAFEEHHEPYFFGRDIKVAELYWKLTGREPPWLGSIPGNEVGALKRHPPQRSPLAVVIGRSGSGKSSLIMAGLLPRLRKDRSTRWRPIAFRPGYPNRDPFVNLAAAIINGDEQASVLAGKLAAGSGALLDELRSRLAGSTPVLIADQFEELFTGSADPDRSSQFISALLATCDDTEAIPFGRVVLAVRHDFLAFLEGQAELLERMRDSLVMLGGLGVGEVGDAIRRPATTLFVDYEGQVVDELVTRMASRPDALPLLQFALESLWSRLRWNEQTQRGLITRDAFAAIASTTDQPSGIEGTLVQHAERMFEQLPKLQQREAPGLFSELVWLAEPGREGEDTRRTRRQSELTVTRWKLALKLSDRDHRLLTMGVDGGTNEPTVEIVHESLIRTWPRLTAWLDEDRGFRLWRQRLQADVARWKKEGWEPAHELQGQQLAEAERWLDTHRSMLAHPSPDQGLVTIIQSAIERRQAQDQERDRLFAEAQKNAEDARRAAEEAVAERDRARTLQVEVTRQRDAALLSRSRILAELSRRTADGIATHDHMTAMLLALHALPSPGFGGDRPVSWEAILALQGSWLNNRELAILEGHRGSVLHATFSPDGRRLVTASDDATARLWDLASANPRATVLEGHTNWVRHATFSPDGRRLVTVSHDETARLWDLTGEQPRATVLEGYTDAVSHAAFSPDGRSLVTVSADNTARLWDLIGEHPRATVLEGHTGPVTHAAFSPDRRYLVTASADNTARLWYLTGKRPRATVLEGHTGPVRHAVFSPDGWRLVTASDDATARLWDLTGEQPRATVLEGHTVWVRHAAFSPDGRHLVMASYDNNTARLWDLTSEHPRATAVLEGHTGPVSHAAFSPDGRRLITTSDDATARLWDVTSEQPRATVLEGHMGPVLHAAFSPDGRRLATASRDKTARLWDLAGEHPRATVLEGHTGPVSHAAPSPDGRFLVTASADNTARLWDLTSEHPRATVLEGHTGPVLHAAFSSDGRRLVTASHDTTAWLRDLTGEHPRVAAVLEGHTGRVSHAVFSPDGRRLVTASDDTTARLWDLTSARPRATVLEGHTDRVPHAVFSPDGRRLITASDDATARLWDLTSAHPRATVLEGHTYSVRHAAFSPDGLRLVTVSFDRTARLWDLTGKQPRAIVLEGHTDWVLHAAFSPDRRYLVTASADHTARLWDLTGKRPRATVLKGHTYSVRHTAFSPDGRRLVTASDDATARLWDLTGEQPRATVLEGHTGPVLHAAFSPDGRRLVTASRDTTARVYRHFPQVETTALIEAAVKSVTRRLTDAQIAAAFLTDRGDVEVGTSS
jgi:WD40 repeat protein